MPIKEDDFELVSTKTINESILKHDDKEFPIMVISIDRKRVLSVKYIKAFPKLALIVYLKSLICILEKK